jgi:hypothetical protein
VTDRILQLDGIDVSAMVESEEALVAVVIIAECGEFYPSTMYIPVMNAQNYPSD